MLAAEEVARTKSAIVQGWLDNPGAEGSYFGIDHCDLGGLMAASWGLLPSFVDVIHNHHEPSEAEHDPYLVEIVAAVEHFLLAKEELAAASDDAVVSSGDAPVPEIPAITERSHSPYDEETWKNISENLYNEYNRVLPLVKESLTSMIGSAR